MGKLRCQWIDQSPAAAAVHPRQAILERHPWIVFCLPWLVYMLAGALEPRAALPGQSPGWPPVAYRYYPIVYTLKIACTLGAILVVLPGYKRFPIRVTLRAPAAGLIGFSIWVGLCWLHPEQRWLARLGLDWLLDMGGRSAYDPFRELALVPVLWAWGFLAVRFIGLVVAVAIAEEFFLRGFLMPLWVRADWWNVPFGTLNPSAVAAAIVYGLATHPAELAAAAAWFSLITWLMAKTRTIWDCVVAHAVTNLLLGVYVVCSGSWGLW